MVYTSCVVGRVIDELAEGRPVVRSRRRTRGCTRASVIAWVYTLDHRVAIAAERGVVVVERRGVHGKRCVLSVAARRIERRRKCRCEVEAVRLGQNDGEGRRQG